MARLRGMSRRRCLVGWGAAGASGGLAALVASCATGGGKTPAGATGGTGAPSLPVPRMVEYWSQYGSGISLDTQNQLLTRYQQLNPGVTVNTAVAPHVQNVPEKTLAAIASGAPPDVGVFDRFVIASFAVKD